MHWRAMLALALGLGLTGFLLKGHDPSAIWQSLRSAGWAMLLPIMLHVPQTFLSALGWAILIDDDRQPSIGAAFRLRWIKEAANALLPVAQIGGDLVRGRLYAQAGGDPRMALAVGLLDIAVELAGQILFTSGALVLVLLGPHGESAWVMSLSAVGGLILLVCGIGMAHRYRAIRYLERVLLRVAKSERWRGFGRFAGLEDCVRRLSRNPGRVLISCIWHILSWTAGAVETFAALWILGLVPTLREALILEAMIQCLGAADFLVPGALGVREGGYLLLGSMFGIAADQALALSFIRRTRECVLGLPALFVWHRLERRAASLSPPRTLRPMVDS